MRLDEIGGQRKITYEEIADSFDVFCKELKQQITQGNIHTDTLKNSPIKNAIVRAYVTKLPSFEKCFIEFVSVNQTSVSAKWHPTYKIMSIPIFINYKITNDQFTDFLKRKIDSILTETPTVSHEFVHLYQSHILAKDSSFKIIMSNLKKSFREKFLKRKGFDSKEEIEAYTLEFWLMYRSLLNRAKEFNYNREQTWKMLYDFSFREKFEDFFKLQYEEYNLKIISSSKLYPEFVNSLKEVHQKIIDLFNQTF